MSSNDSQIQAKQLLKDSLTYAAPIYVPMLTFFIPGFVISLLGLGMTPGAAVLVSLINVLGIFPFITGAAIFYAHQNLTNRGSTIPDSLQAAGERFSQLVLLTFIFYVAIFAGLILLIIPGLYLSIRLSFVYYALMIERRSAFDSLSRSWQLTQGHWWKLFWIFLVFFIAVFIPACILIILFVSIDPGGAEIGGSLFVLLLGPITSVYYVLLFMSFVNLANDDEAT